MHYLLPNLHAEWPFPKMINPYYAEVTQESIEWIEEFRVFSGKNENKFRRINAGLLAAFAYPHHSRAHLRVACDLMNVLFAVDDVSDVLDGYEAQSLAERILAILKDDEFRNPGPDHPATNLHQNFFAAVRKASTPTAFRWFSKDYERYMQAMVNEAKDREHLVIRQSIEEYLALRRFTGAIKPSFDMIMLPLNIPDEILEDPRIVDLEFMAIDMVAVANDVVSFNVEQARGDIHNLAIVLMNAHSLGVQDAMNAVCKWYHQRARDFVLAMKNLPTTSEMFGPENRDPQVDEDVKTYVWGLGNWVTANYEWSFESERFWGGAKLANKGGDAHEVVVELMPKKKGVNGIVKEVAVQQQLRQQLLAPAPTKSSLPLGLELHMAYYILPLPFFALLWLLNSMYY